MRIGKLMLDLKKRYWERCFLIIGNRDANKLRLPSELSDAEVYERPLEEMPLVSKISEFFCQFNSICSS